MVADFKSNQQGETGTGISDGDGGLAEALGSDRSLSSRPADSVVTGTEEVKNPLQQSQLHKKGLCDYVINVASGCLHGCTFCYVPSTPAIRAFLEHLQDKGVENPQYDWGKYLFVREAICDYSPVHKNGLGNNHKGKEFLPTTILLLGETPSLAQQLEEVLNSKRTWQETPAGKGVVMLCSGTDPYQNNRTAAITRACVEVLLKYSKRVRILTRSPLWTKDLDILVNPLVTVGMSLPHLNNSLSRQIEPDAPLPSDRYLALQKGAAAGCRLFVAMAPTPPSMGLPEFQEHLSKLIAINPEVIFWEPINARGTNGTRMLDAGIEFAKDISNTKIWAENSIRQWQELETAASLTGCQELLHIWPDSALKGYIDSDKLKHWWSRPTVEQWQFEDPQCKPQHPEDPQEAPTNNIADSQYSFSKLDISFGHTCDRLLSGNKTVTRREWKPRHVAKFIKAYENKQLVRALSKDRRYKGQQVGWLKLTSAPRSEALSQITQADCAAEGYPELTPREFHQRFFKDLGYDTEVWVISFQFIPSYEIPESTVPSSQATNKQETTTFTMAKDDSSLTPDRTPEHPVEKEHLTTCSEQNLTAKQLTLLPELSPEFSQVSSWTKDCWRTPNNFEQPILDLVAKALGGTIGLDPTADDRHLVPAQRYFTKTDNCLIQDDWESPAGTVFMNPPFSNPLPFLEKLVNAIQQGQVKEAIVLLPVSCLCNQGTGPLIDKYAQMTCHWYSRRIAFVGEDGQVHKKPNIDCCLIYFGINSQRFSDVFEKFGTISPVNPKKAPKLPENSLTNKQGLSRKNQPLAALTHTAIKGRYEAASIYPGWQTAASINYIKEKFDLLNSQAAKAAFADKWIGQCAQNIETALRVCNELLEIIQLSEVYKVPEWMEGNVAYSDFNNYFDKRLNLPLQKWLQLLQKNSRSTITDFNQISSQKPQGKESDRQLSEPDSPSCKLPLPNIGDRQLSEPTTPDRQLPSPDTSDRRLREFSTDDRQLSEPPPSDRQLPEPPPSDRQLSDTSDLQLPSPDTSDRQLLSPDPSVSRLPEPTNEFDLRSSEFGVKPDTSNRRLSKPDLSDRQLLSPDPSDRRLSEPTNEFSVRSSEFGVNNDRRLSESTTSDHRSSESTNEFDLRPSEFDLKPDTNNRRLSELDPSDRQLPKLNCVDQQLLSPNKSDRQLPSPANKNKFSVKTPNSEGRRSNSKKRAPKNQGSGYLEKILCNVQRNLARGKDPDYYWQYHYFYTDENGIAKHRSTHVSKSLYSTVCDLISSGRCHEEILLTLKKKKR